MSYEIYGPFGEIYELRSILDGGDDVGSDLAFADEAMLVPLLHRFLETPGNREVLRQVLMNDPLAPSHAMTDYELLELLARRLSMGVMRLGSIGHGQLQWETRGSSGGGGSAAQESAREERPPQENEVKIRDWRIECGHHASSAARAIIERGTRIQVVPSVSGNGPHKDTVLLNWRDDYIGSLPGSLPVRSPGQPESEARKTGSDGPYSTYTLDAVYRGESDIRRAFWLPAYWQDYREKTTYTIGPGPQPIEVQVFHPHKYKFELKLPPWATFKDGHKWDAPEGANVKALAKPANLKYSLETEDSHWKPSSLSISTTTDGSKTETSRKLDSVKLTRDGRGLNLDALHFIGKLLKFQESFRSLLQTLKKFKDYAPQMGWYIDVEVQLMQGALAAEWYYKEHTDHRVFEYLDVNVSMKIFEIKFEGGFGVSAFSFKLQVFASITGELGVEGGLKRDDPDAGLGVTFPKITGKITGALGARLEGGAFFKFEAKGETAIEAEVTVGFNQRNSPMIFDAKARWTGVEFTATGSVGLWGIGGTRTVKCVAVQPSSWVGLELPAEQPNEPPSISKARIEQILVNHITDGWNVRVIKPSGSMFTADTHWTPQQIAAAIADEIAKDPAFDRTEKTVEGMAHAVRGDLDALGSRWGRDWVEESAFRSYLSGPLQPRIRAARSPERILIAANS